jgi:sugar lactone lactonase YvrE
MLLYWSDGSVGSINRLDLSTGKAVVLVNDLEVPLGIAISPERDRLYWSELGKQAIFQANLDGSGVTPLLNEVGVPAGIALDDERGRLYWADAIGEIRYTSLDEPSVEILVAEGVEMPRDVALGPASGRVYWTDTRRDLVGYVDPTGGEAQFILSDDLLSPISLAVCEDSEVIYVTDDGADAVYRLPVAGGAAFVRYKPFHPTGIVMDCGSATLYWSDIATSAIYVGNLEQDETQRRLYPASE